MSQNACERSGDVSFCSCLSSLPFSVLKASLSQKEGENICVHHRDARQDSTAASPAPRSLQAPLGPSPHGAGREQCELQHISMHPLTPPGALTGLMACGFCFRLTEGKRLPKKHHWKDVTWLPWL